MTTEAYPDGDPHRLLARAHELVRRVRRDQRATWFPLLVALVYLAVVLVPVTFGRDQFNPPWYSYPVIAQGSVLLAAGIGFALAQRPLRSSAR
jgi:hypothetical protein